MKKQIKGFSLIELMIVVAIIGVLAAIAIPSYRDYVVKAKIQEAVSELASRRMQSEQYFQDNRTYADGGFTNAGCAAGASQHFAFTCTTQTATTYTIQANGTGTMAGFTFTIDQDNNRATTAAASDWTANATCWVTKRDGSC